MILNAIITSGKCRHYCTTRVNKAWVITTMFEGRAGPSTPSDTALNNPIIFYSVLYNFSEPDH